MKTLSGTLLGLAVMAAGLSPLAKAAEPALNPADVIEGMGERIPPGKQNVSLSPLFKAYVFEKAGLKFVQINSLKDEVITVIVVTPGAESRLPIGSAAGQPLPVLKGDAAS
ncbi:hypothetical protein [Xanthomonas rydalmerensis]|uniref:Uncharacterized protein n=1 Tax=Xanthomonas rydalmerensis TaxID=3046274 RepID=A0ABZ0JJE5_9XANT|nr:hypothetical protein [Xanthomonas sp. DM-2023]WOS39924.1 hypothetical protein QN243_16115 [Xanthomonas sp. DM-2023]WOS44108.1 hypothetical protein QN242_16115 [Xanthomonas sp. DM-2023]WOS48288.1 hypothetical protein QN240_16115 [Xanthomonas sp. DM-2023]WOS52467.1 hypothetical protein QN244_16115 [Xanthomonas sp. DM-2023]WOS56651.1 hypothetical protein QN245_16115 [Xanthomonas sp. DM-2023]